jgi:pilus assembly protein Flp/PilA
MDVVGGGRRGHHRKVVKPCRVDLWVRFGTAALRISSIRRKKRMKHLLKNFLNDESGQDLIEYALIAALISLVAITGLNGLASKINSEFTAVGGDI